MIPQQTSNQPVPSPTQLARINYIHFCYLVLNFVEVSHLSIYIKHAHAENAQHRNRHTQPQPLLELNKQKTKNHHS